MPHIRTRVIQSKMSVEILEKSCTEHRKNRAKVTGRTLYSYISQILKSSVPKTPIVDVSVEMLKAYGEKYGEE